MESINTGVEFYSNVKASEVEWVWYPYIPCGKITMLQGDPGEGKSTLIIHVAAILWDGIKNASINCVDSFVVVQMSR